MAYPSAIDINDPEEVVKIIQFAKEQKCESIMQAAWYSNKYQDYENSEIHASWTNFTIELAQKTLQEGLRFITFGTCLDQTEIPKNNYVKEKKRLASSLRENCNSDLLLLLRPFYVFDINALRPRLVKNFLSSSKSFVVNSPNSYLDYVHIDDLAGAASIAIQEEMFGPVDLGSGLLTSNIDFLKSLSKFTQPISLELNNAEISLMKEADMSSFESRGWRPTETLSFLQITSS